MKIVFLMDEMKISRCARDAPNGDNLNLPAWQSKIFQQLLGIPSAARDLHSMGQIDCCSIYLKPKQDSLTAS